MTDRTKSCVPNENGKCMFCGAIMSYPTDTLVANEKDGMKTYQVEYSATYWVKADSEEQAIELAIDEHASMPDGDWSAFVDPYDSDNFNTLGEK